MQRHCDFDPTLNTGNIKRRRHRRHDICLFKTMTVVFQNTLLLYVFWGYFSSKDCGLLQVTWWENRDLGNVLQK